MAWLVKYLSYVSDLFEVSKIHCTWKLICFLKLDLYNFIALNHIRMINPNNFPVEYVIASSKMLTLKLLEYLIKQTISFN